jgi:GTP pyrophosphokinase
MATSWHHGQPALDCAVGVASTLASLTDVETRIAGLMFELTLLDPSRRPIEPRFGKCATWLAACAS